MGILHLLLPPALMLLPLEIQDEAWDCARPAPWYTSELQKMMRELR